VIKKEVQKCVAEAFQAQFATYRHDNKLDSDDNDEGGSLCEPVLSHSWFSSIEVVGRRGSVHMIFGSISVHSAVLGSSWLVMSLPPTPTMCRQQPNEWVGANSFPRQLPDSKQLVASFFLATFAIHTSNYKSLLLLCSCRASKHNRRCYSSRVESHRRRDDGYDNR
jgi:hypothetical protein